MKVHLARTGSTSQVGRMEVDSGEPEEVVPSQVSRMEVDEPEVPSSPPSPFPGSPIVTAALSNPLPEVMPDLDTQSDALPPPLTRSGRPRREYRLPKRFRDNLPEPPAPAPAIPDPDPPTSVRRVILIVRDRLITLMNSFGVWRDYPERPSVDPDSFLNLEDFSNAHHHGRSAPDAIPSESLASDSGPSHWPFLNATVYGVMQWLNNGNTMKSEVETTKLIHNVILSPNFDPADLAGFDAHRENQRFDKAVSQSTKQTQFIESSVDILVPSGESNVEGRTFTIPGLQHRKLTSVIREAFEGPLAHLFHYSPFKIFQKSPISGKDERIYGEIYTSDSFLKETERVRRHGLVPPEDPECKREKVVAALMVSSDATMLTQFGMAKGWPIYLMFGNLSKYIRAQPGSGAMHHVAYIPSVSHLERCIILFLHSLSYQNRSGILSRLSTRSGEVKRIRSLLTVAENSFMLFGPKFLMMTSCMPASMVLSSSVLMELSAASIHGCSLIQQTIQKSRWPLMHISNIIN